MMIFLIILGIFIILCWIFTAISAIAGNIEENQRKAKEFEKKMFPDYKPPQS